MSRLLACFAVLLCGLAEAQQPELPRAFGAVQPRISPDGAAIAFSYQGAIWRMPRTGGEMQRLTSGRRLARVNEKGERIFVEDAERERRAAALKNDISRSCP